MAARHAAQERRAAGRQKRRSAPPETEEQTMSSETAETIWEAASAAIVGAAVGAAQAIARQREEARAADEESEAENQERGSENLVPEFDSESQPDSESESQPEPEPEAAAAPEPDSEPGRPGDAPKMVQRARQQLLELRGVEPESVSGIARTASGWRIGLEVVEVHRIPESTDVLATYELELDADGELLTFERTQRYYRSEADRR